MPTEINGMEVEQVGDLIGGTATRSTPRAVPPPTPAWAPPYPGVGIYFGMSDDYYHSIHACSASGLKTMLMSSMDYWACSVMNPERDDDDTTFKLLGRAYHARILEGRDAFEARYAPLLEHSDFGTPGEDFAVTVDHIRKFIREAGGEPKGTAKPALIEQLLDIDPGAIVWDKECEDHAKLHEGKTLLPADAYKRINIAARMIENSEYLSEAVTGGHPEVALFWYCPVTGAPMKAKLDYLKLNALIDLKSFSNKARRPVERAIDFAIANEKYYLPVVIYLEGIAEVKRLIREQGGLDRVFAWEPQFEEDGQTFGGEALAAPKELKEWAWAWAHQPEPDVLFIFQQTGHAPVTRGRFMTKGSVYRINEIAAEALKKKWVACARAYGCDPWIDEAPITPVIDEHIPMSGTDFGETR